MLVLGEPLGRREHGIIRLVRLDGRENRTRVTLRRHAGGEGSSGSVCHRATSGPGCSFSALVIAPSSGVVILPSGWRIRSSRESLQ